MLTAAAAGTTNEVTVWLRAALAKLPLSTLTCGTRPMNSRLTLLSASYTGAMRPVKVFDMALALSRGVDVQGVMARWAIQPEHRLLIRGRSVQSKRRDFS